MSSNASRRIGLRLYELESAFAANLNSTSPRLRSYKVSRLLGQAARLCQLIRGQDVIEDLDKLTAMAALQLKIDPMHFEDVIDVLKEADLVEERKGNPRRSRMVLAHFFKRKGPRTPSEKPALLRRLSRSALRGKAEIQNLSLVRGRGLQKGTIG